MIPLSKFNMLNDKYYDDDDDDTNVYFSMCWLSRQFIMGNFVIEFVAAVYTRFLIESFFMNKFSD